LILFKSILLEHLHSSNAIGPERHVIAEGYKQKFHLRITSQPIVLVRLLFIH